MKYIERLNAIIVIYFVFSILGCETSPKDSGRPGKVKNTFAVSEYGCVVNDGIDDSKCLQDAIDAMVANDVAGSILFLDEQGDYELKSGKNLYIDWNKVYFMRGAGVSGITGGTRLVWNAPGGDAVKSVIVENGGSDCKGDPKIVFSGGGANPVHASAVALRQGPTGTGTVDFIHVPLESQGSGYTSIPRVIVSGAGCVGVKARAVMHHRKPVLRIIAPLFPHFENFNITAATDVATGILLETKTGKTSRSAVFDKIYVQGISGNVEKAVVTIDGDQSAINYPGQAGPKGTGPDWNNDLHDFSKMEVSNYSVAGFSFEMSQSKSHRMNKITCNASPLARQATVDATRADGDTISNNALDIERGPYCTTTLLAQGAGQPGNGGSFFIKDCASNINAYDFGISSNDASAIENCNIENSKRFLLTCGRGVSTAAMPLTVSGIRWANSHTGDEGPAVDEAGIISLGCVGPFKFYDNTFQGPTAEKTFSSLHGRIYHKARVSFDHNSVRWRDNVSKIPQGSVDNDFFSGNTTGLDMHNNAYLNSKGETAFKDSERHLNGINNFSATTPPGVDDDGDLGYVAGSQWLDTVAKKYYVCVSNANGAAIWIVLN